MAGKNPPTRSHRNESKGGRVGPKLTGFVPACRWVSVKLYRHQRKLGRFRPKFGGSRRKFGPTLVVIVRGLVELNLCFGRIRGNVPPHKFHRASARSTAMAWRTLTPTHAVKPLVARAGVRRGQQPRERRAQRAVLEVAPRRPALLRTQQVSLWGDMGKYGFGRLRSKFGLNADLLGTSSDGAGGQFEKFGPGWPSSAKFDRVQENVARSWSSSADIGYKVS